MAAWPRPLADLRQRDRVAAGVAVEGELELTPDDTGILLDLARAAAHDSGQRTNAPLLCYLVGLAAAKSDTELNKIAVAAKAGR